MNLNQSMNHTSQEVTLSNMFCMNWLHDTQDDQSNDLYQNSKDQLQSPLPTPKSPTWWKRILLYPQPLVLTAYESTPIFI